MKSLIIRIVLYCFGIVCYGVITDCGGAGVYTDYCRNHNKLVVFALVVLGVEVIHVVVSMYLRRKYPRQEWENRWFHEDED